MKFLLDENFPKAAITMLEERGHEWFDPRDTDLKGSDDRVLVEEALRTDAVILTTDRDYYHTLRHEFPEHRGLVVFALKQPNRAAILDRLEWFLDNIAPASLPGRAFQLRDRTWVSQPPIEGEETG